MRDFDIFIKDALLRAFRTFCQALITLIPADQISIIDLDWPHMLGIAATMAAVSLLTSFATGLPETQLKTEGILFTPEWDDMIGMTEEDDEIDGQDMEEGGDDE